MQCVYCGYATFEGDSFCEGCGQRIEAPAPNPAPAQMTAKSYACANVQTSRSVSVEQSKMLLVFMVDNSVSASTYINQLFDDMNRFYTDILSDDIAKNALEIAVIKFNDTYGTTRGFPGVSSAQSSLPLTGGSSSYSAPIREALLMAEEYTKSNARAYKPWVIMITPSEPSDDITSIAHEVQNMQNADKLRFMALGVLDYSPAALKKLTDVVFRQKGTDFASFFTWISQCVKVIVRTKPGEKPQLPQLTGDVYRDR